VIIKRMFGLAADAGMNSPALARLEKNRTATNRNARRFFTGVGTCDRQRFIVLA
jgi:hypothetical protein